jgi:periplasmic copper chaperone A
MFRLTFACVSPLAAWCFGLALALVGGDADALFIVNQPWVVPAAKGQTTAAYMDLTSTEGATLVAAKSDAAARVSIGGPKREASVARLALPAGEMIRLAPSGYRIVLDRLARPIKLGDRVMLTLTIEAADGSRQDIPVNAEARRRSPLDDERRAHSH